MADDDSVVFTTEDGMADDDFELHSAASAADDDEFTPDPQEDADDDDAGDEDFTLQGYDDFRLATPGHEDDEAPPPKRSRPAFHGRSMKDSLRSGRRVMFNQDDDFLMLESDDEDKQQKALRTTSRIPGTFGRRNREKGSTLPAYHKKVTADLDSDDEMMLEMRDQGYSDRQIADRLAKEGRVRYDMKSIATRVYRIKDAQAKHVDYLLKEGYVEWKLDDDQILLRAYDLADIEIRYEMERLRAWRFRKVSEYMRRLNKTTIFSSEACAARYSALMNGTAVIPSEIDDDPEARKREQLEFVSKREHEREVVLRAKEKKEDEERRIKDESRARQAKKAAETAAKREAKEIEKTNRAVLRATKAQLRQQRAVENSRKKEERKSQLENEKRRREREKRTRDHMNSIYGLGRVKDIARHAQDPRDALSTQELRVLCQRRGLPADGAKPELLKAIIDQDKHLDAADLHDLCQERKIPLGGNKTIMKYQLALFEARSFEYHDAGSDDDDNDEVFEGVRGANALHGQDYNNDDDAILDFGDDDSDDGGVLSDFD